MKPTTNRVYCIGCRRSKMLFGSQAKADNFIRFNCAEITGHSDTIPSRSYYCTFCCGWHVTSIRDEETGALCDRLDERLWEEIALRNRLIDIDRDCLEIEALIEYTDFAGAAALAASTLSLLQDCSSEAERKNFQIKGIKTLEERIIKLQHDIFLAQYSPFTASPQNHY